MGKTTNAVLADCDRLIQVWTENPTFSMGDLTLTAVKAQVNALRTKNDALSQARTELSRLIDETNDGTAALEQIVSRGRSGIRAAFGPDSAQYAQVGGTRASERKPRSSKGGGSNKPTT